MLYVLNLLVFTCLILFSRFQRGVLHAYRSLTMNRWLSNAEHCTLLFSYLLCISPVSSSWRCKMSAAAVFVSAAAAVSVAGPVLRAAVALSGRARGLAGAVAGGPRGGGGSDADFSTCRSRCALGRLLWSPPAASSAEAPSSHSPSHNPNPITSFIRYPVPHCTPHPTLKAQD